MHDPAVVAKTLTRAQFYLMLNGIALVDRQAAPEATHDYTAPPSGKPTKDMSREEYTAWIVSQGS